MVIEERQEQKLECPYQVNANPNLCPNVLSPGNKGWPNEVRGLSEDHTNATQAAFSRVMVRRWSAGHWGTYAKNGQKDSKASWRAFF